MSDNQVPGCKGVFPHRDDPIPTDISSGSVEGPLDLERTSMVRRQEQLSRAENRTLDVDRQIALQRLQASQCPQKGIETYSRPSDHLYKAPSPIFNSVSSEDIVHKHLPRQRDIDRMLESIRRKCINDYRLPVSHTAIKIEQQKCPTFKDMYSYLSSGLLPTLKSKAKSIMRQAEQYLLVQGILFKMDFLPGGENFKLALCLPDNMIHIVVHHYHDSLFSSHQGVQQTFLSIRKNYYAHNLYDRIYAYIRSCMVCQQRKSQAAPSREREFIPRIFDNYRPFSEVHVDVKKMFRSNDGFHHIIVSMCVLTHYVILIPLRWLDAISTAKALLQRIMFTFGTIDKIVSDLGTNFNNKVLMHIYNALK